MVSCQGKLIHFDKFQTVKMTQLVNLLLVHKFDITERHKYVHLYFCHSMLMFSALRFITFHIPVMLYEQGYAPRSVSFSSFVTVLISVFLTEAKLAPVLLGNMILWDCLGVYILLLMETSLCSVCLYSVLSCM